MTQFSNNFDIRSHCILFFFDSEDQRDDDEMMVFQQLINAALNDDGFVVIKDLRSNYDGLFGGGLLGPPLSWESVCSVAFALRIVFSYSSWLMRSCKNHTRNF